MTEAVQALETKLTFLNLQDIFTNALVDSGASHNLISIDFARKLGITPKLQNRYASLADGKRVQLWGSHTLMVQVSDLDGISTQRSHNFNIANIAKYEAVLGYSWLKQVNPVIDWQDATWQFPRSADIESKDDFETTGEAFMIHWRCEVESQIVNDADEVIQLYSLLPEQFSRLPAGLADFADSFDDKEAEDSPPEHAPYDHTITTEDGKAPPWLPIYNLSQDQLSVLKHYLSEALRKGWIRPSKSPAGAPILFAPKADGSLRLCVDYRALNKITVKDKYPLPLISEILDRLSGSQIYTKLDLKDAYHRIRIKQGHEWKTAFRTRYGHFEYLVMPFGLTNAPATFQAHINSIFVDLLDITVIVYLDDILIFSKDPADHLKHVREVLYRLKQNNLYCRLDKCIFSATEVDFLGFVVSTNGIAMEKSRVKSIEDWPVPGTFREIQVFMGFANFYRRFILGFSGIAQPLTALLKGMTNGVKTGEFDLGDKGKLAFKTLQDAFTKAPVLVHFDPTKKSRLETDASGFAIAGVISQQVVTIHKADGKPQKHWHPVAFYSRKMIIAERNYEVHDSELLAIVESFKHWRHYFEGSNFPIEVLTDHNNLRYFMTTCKLSGRQARWALELSRYDFEIHHRPGTLNPADGPSRRPDYALSDGEVDILLPTFQQKLRHSLIVDDIVKTADQDDPQKQQLLMYQTSLRHRKSSRERPLTSKDFRQAERGLQHLIPRALVHTTKADETAADNTSYSMAKLLKTVQENDAFCRMHKSKLMTSLTAVSEWHLDSNDILRREGAIVVPEDMALRAEIMSMCHDDPHAGHFGRDRTIDLVKRKYYWHSMRKDVADYVQSCDICQRTKAKRHSPYGNLNVLPQSTAKWTHLTMDFITGVPYSKNSDGVEFDAIFVVVDRFTKMALYIPCQKTIDASELADLFIKHVTARFGNPQSIVSDRGTLFTSKFWSTLCYALRIKSRLSTAFHPQTDGQTERQNQTLEQYLRSYVNYQQDDWLYWLPMAEFSYNNSTQSSTGMTPFFAMYGYHPTADVDTSEPTIPGQAPNASLLTEELETLRKDLASRWAEAVEQQKKYYDVKHTPKTYAVGDYVYLSSKNVIDKRPSKKLDWKWLGPFKITKAVGKQAYELDLSGEYGRLHNVFHVSLLELAKGRKGKALPKPKPFELDGQEVWMVDEILDSRVRYGKRQFLVHWQNTGPAIDSWEPMENLLELDAFKAYLKDNPEVKQGMKDSKKRKKKAVEEEAAPVRKNKRLKK